MHASPVYYVCCCVCPRWTRVHRLQCEKLSSNRVVTYFQRLSSGAPISCSLDSPHCHIQGRSWRTCFFRRVCHLRGHCVSASFNMEATLQPSVKVAYPLSSTHRDIFRAVSQILSYIGLNITAQPAVVQDAGSY